MKKTLLLTPVILLFSSCNRTYYPYLTTNDIVSNGWYKFTDFRYSGQLSNGKPNGEGILIYQNGIKIEGNFRSGVLHDDNATYHIPSVGVIHGKAYYGKLTFGQIDYNDGSYYKGNLDSYEPNGKGLLVNPYGDIYSGSFGNGKPHGSGVQYLVSSGIKNIGNFRNGKPDGEIASVSRNGKISGRIFENGSDQTESKVNSMSKSALVNIENRVLKTFDERTNSLNSKSAEVNIAEAWLYEFYGSNAKDFIRSMTEDHLKSECYKEIDNIATLEEKDTEFFL